MLDMPAVLLSRLPRSEHTSPCLFKKALTQPEQRWAAFFAFLLPIRAL